MSYFPGRRYQRSAESKSKPEANKKPRAVRRWRGTLLRSRIGRWPWRRRRHVESAARKRGADHQERIARVDARRPDLQRIIRPLLILLHLPHANRPMCSAPGEFKRRASGGVPAPDGAESAQSFAGHTVNITAASPAAHTSVFIRNFPVEWNSL
jgi:hypothetical protein